MKTEINNSYSKFMNDIIDLGVWKNLSPAARTLYIVLLKFSNGELKPVWPSTALLMELTGYKQKKSIIEARKNLKENGLIIAEEGSGHTNTRYYFVESYKNTPQGVKKIHLRESKKYTSGSQKNTPQGVKKIHPNQYINQVHEPNNDILTKIKDNEISCSKVREKFISWSKDKIPHSTRLINSIDIKSNKGIVYIRKSSIPKNLELITKKFFEKNKSLVVQFLDEKNW